MGRIIIVSHFLPFHTVRKDSSFVFEKQTNDHSALYSGILSLQQSANCVYIGLVDRYSDDDSPGNVCDLTQEERADLKIRMWEDVNCIRIKNLCFLSFDDYSRIS